MNRFGKIAVVCSCYRVESSYAACKNCMLWWQMACSYFHDQIPLCPVLSWSTSAHSTHLALTQRHCVREREREGRHPLCLFLHITLEICARVVLLNAVLTCRGWADWFNRIIRLIASSDITLNWFCRPFPYSLSCHDFPQFLLSCCFKVTGCRCFCVLICASQCWQYVILG